MREKFDINIDNLEVKSVKIASIRMEDRFREDLGDIDQLAQSITKDGLIQPIAVQHWEDDGYEYNLVAGGRRLTAIKKIAEKTGNTEISCRIYPGDLDPLQMITLEFAENFYRKDMTWQEEVKIKQKIHELQVKQYGIKTSTSQDAPGWSMGDTAKLINKSKATVSQDLSLANMMNDLPQIDWNQFESKNDAQRAIKKVRETIDISARAAKVASTVGSGDSKIKNIIDSYHVTDFFKMADGIGPGTMDLVEIDPPYAIDLQGQKKGYAYTGYNEIDPKDYPEFMQKVLKASYAMMKPNSWLVCWFGPEPWFEQMYQWITKAGFRTNRMVGIWAKGKEEEDGSVPFAGGQTNSPQYVLANGYEMFYLARKGTPMLAKPGVSNLFGESPVHAGAKIHPTERPIPLLTRIIQALVMPGSNICVPFAGSGNTLIAAYKNQCLAIGSDLTKEYKDGYMIKVNNEFG